MNYNKITITFPQSENDFEFWEYYMSLIGFLKDTVRSGKWANLCVDVAMINKPRKLPWYPIDLRHELRMMGPPARMKD